MNCPKVSVIIPAYNQANFLGDAIQSVLNQDYSNFEIIVVDDASPDHTREVVKQFDDPRHNYLVHAENRRLSAARNTGVLASSGDIIALLDADDFFHPEKLRLHVEFLKKHPEIGATYNSRFELNYSSNTIRELWRPPLEVGLADFVLGFPFAPSDMVMRREWALYLFDERVGTAEDTDFPSRLAMAGCKFAGIDRALNYRRYHSNRPRKNLETRLRDVTGVLSQVFADSRCTEGAKAVRDRAYMSHHLDIGLLALTQTETMLGQRFVREAVNLDPSLVRGHPSRLVVSLVTTSVRDEHLDHAALLRSMFAHLPLEVQEVVEEQYDWAVAQGYLLKGTRAIIWGRPDDGRDHFARATQLGAKVEEPFLRSLAHQLLGFEFEFGLEATENVLSSLRPYFDALGDHDAIHSLHGFFWINRAFQCYASRQYTKVPGSVLRAFINRPKFVGNRGALAILLHSVPPVIRVEIASISRYGPRRQGVKP